MGVMVTGDMGTEVMSHVTGGRDRGTGSCFRCRVIRGHMSEDRSQKYCHLEPTSPSFTNV